MYKFTVEYTDTFGGEANYCWVKRDSFMLESADVKFVKAFAKNLMGLTGVKGKWEDYDYGLIFRPRGSCTVMFVDFGGEL